MLLKCYLPLKKFTTSWTIEPAMLIYTLAGGVYTAMVPNLIQQKACSPDIEPSIYFVCNDTRLVAEATDIVTLRSTLRQFLPIAALLLAGCWRDATGRNKPILYLALFAEISGLCIEFYGVLHWHTSVWVISLIDAFVTGLAGSTSLFLAAASFVIADNSEPENRTTRFGALMAVSFAGLGTSYAVSGYVLNFLGYRQAMILVLGLAAVTLLLVYTIDDKKRKVTEENSGKWQTFKKLKTVFRSRPNNAVVWLMIISYCLMATSMSAEGVLLLYYLQHGFQLPVTIAGMFKSYKLIIGVVSFVVSPWFFKKLLKLSDYKSGMLCALVNIVSCLAMALAKTKLQAVFFVCLDLFKAIPLIVPKSIITQSVTEDEVGTFLSLLAIGECVLPIAIFSIYNAVFDATSSTMPGAIFFVSSACNCLILICYRCYKSDNGSFWSYYYNSDNHCYHVLEPYNKVSPKYSYVGEPFLFVNHFDVQFSIDFFFSFSNFIYKPPTKTENEEI